MLRIPSEPADAAAAWRALQTAVVLLVLGSFLYSVRGILNPFLLFLLLLFVLAPLRGTRAYLLLVSSTATLALIWALNTTGFLLAPFVLALVLAYIQHPLVTRMERWGIPRAWGTALLCLPAVAGIGLVIFLGIPALTAQVGDFIRRSPVLLQDGTVRLERLLATLAARDVPGLDEQALIARLRGIQPEQVVAYLESQQQALARAAWTGVLGVGRGLGTLLSLLSYVFLTPILVFYLLRDWPQLQARVAEMVPVPHRTGVYGFARRFDGLLSGYLRGQVMEAAAVGVLTWIGLWIVGFPYAMMLGVVAAVFNLVPYLGLVVTALPGLVIALFEPNPLLALVKMGAVFVVVQVLDGSVLGPKIVGDSVGMHPVTVILALAVFGFFFGFVGLLIAVPLAVLLSLVLEAAMARYRDSTFYQGESRVSPLA